MDKVKSITSLCDVKLTLWSSEVLPDYTTLHFMTLCIIYKSRPRSNFIMMELETRDIIPVSPNHGKLHFMTLCTLHIPHNRSRMAKFGACLTRGVNIARCLTMALKSHQNAIYMHSNIPRKAPTI